MKYTEGAFGKCVATSLKYRIHLLFSSRITVNFFFKDSCSHYSNETCHRILPVAEHPFPRDTQRIYFGENIPELQSRIASADVT